MFNVSNFEFSSQSKWGATVLPACSSQFQLEQMMDLEQCHLVIMIQVLYAQQQAEDWYRSQLLCLGSSHFEPFYEYHWFLPDSGRGFWRWVIVRVSTKLCLTILTAVDTRSWTSDVQHLLVLQGWNGKQENVILIGIHPPSCLCCLISQNSLLSQNWQDDQTRCFRELDLCDTFLRYNCHQLSVYVIRHPDMQVSDDGSEFDTVYTAQEPTSFRLLAHV